MISIPRFICAPGNARYASSRNAPNSRSGTEPDTVSTVVAGTKRTVTGGVEEGFVDGALQLIDDALRVGEFCLHCLGVSGQQHPCCCRVAGGDDLRDGVEGDIEVTQLADDAAVGDLMDAVAAESVRRIDVRRNEEAHAVIEAHGPSPREGSTD